ncbi:MAG: CehA/McbA family metallohydrolase [archaeon]|nr:CehA/McbA family metallohydrolase [archaeon]
MKADLHIHTTYSSDGHQTPQQVIDKCVELGIGIVAITDHNEFKAYDDVKDNGKVIVIPAEEVTSADGHIVALGIDRQIPRDLGIQETIDLIHEAGGYAIAAHPYRRFTGLGPKNTRNFPFDGTEALNGRSTPGANRKSLKLANSIGKPVTAGSDAHRQEHMGEGYLILPDDITTWEEAVKAIMDGKGKPEGTSKGIIGLLTYTFGTFFRWVFRGFKWT